MFVIRASGPSTSTETPQRCTCVCRNGLKWSVSVRDWPWCNLTNTLAVSLDLFLANNATANYTSANGAGGASGLRISLGDAYTASLAFLPYALESPNGTTRMPINLSVNKVGLPVKAECRLCCVLRAVLVFSRDLSRTLARKSL